MPSSVGMPSASDARRCGQNSAISPMRFCLSRNRTRSWPSRRTRRVHLPSNSDTAAIGCQSRRIISPHGVPFPTRVSNSFCSAVSIASVSLFACFQVAYSRAAGVTSTGLRTSMTARIRIGIAGMGAAGRAFLPAIRNHAEFALAAIAEPVAAIRDSVATDAGAAGFADVRSMLVGTELDALYIATPTELHAEHAGLAFAANKHVLTEKPMAIRLDDGLRMVAAAERAGVRLVVGHAHGFDRPIQAMREIIASGRLGGVRMMQDRKNTSLNSSRLGLS